MPAGKHTARLISDLKRHKIVLALAKGESKRSIARSQRISHMNVSIILEQEWEQVNARKQLLAAQAERNAFEAGEQLSHWLRAGKIPINSLVPVYGVSMDKAIALRNDPQQINLNVTGQVQHAHSANAIFDRLNELADKLNAEAKAKRPMLRNAIDASVTLPSEGGINPICLEPPRIATPKDTERSRMPLESFYEVRPLS